MKKLLLFLAYVLLPLSLFAQGTPAITLAVEVDGKPRDFSFIVKTEGQKLSIDWGDGTLVETDVIASNIAGGSTTVTGTPVGEGNVKIYGEGILYFSSISKVDGAAITAVNVTNAPDLVNLMLTTNKITEIDLSKNTKLETLSMSKNKLSSLNLTANTALMRLEVEENQIASIDLSANTELSTLRMSKNPMSSIDLSANTKLKMVYLLNCGLTSANFGNNATTGLFLSLGGNLFTTFDATTIPGLATARGELSLRDNQLTSIKADGVARLNVAINNLPLSELPVKVGEPARYNYQPQRPMTIAGSIEVNQELDLSAQNNLTDAAGVQHPTTYTWKTASGTPLVAGTDYTENAGKFTFLKPQTEAVYAVLTTPVFPKFTGMYEFRTSEITVTGTPTGIQQVEAAASSAVQPIYDLNGRYVGNNLSALPKGVYVVNGKKVVK